MSSLAYVCKQFVEDVTAYLDGALPADVVALIDAHLADCPHCREYLAEMRRTIVDARALSEHDIDAMPSDLRRRLMEAFLDRDL
ncbi:MAG TPA: zf-HC2 domain-containing protein [Acidimicrobiia bacterium]|nr:zf-HC2 domain-containing protein [Acidimicrobiia bacterium]